MVPCVQDDSTDAPLKFTIKEVGLDFPKGAFDLLGIPSEPMRIKYPALVSTDTMCVVREINGKFYAVLRRGLLSLDHN